MPSYSIIVPELVAGNYALAPGFKSPDPSKNDYMGYQKYTEDKFPPEAPTLYGLHQNAEISRT